jgi:hypothetical protein
MSRQFFDKVYSKKTTVLALFLACLFNSPIIAQQQGVKGQLYLVTGNQMPSPNRKHIPRKGVVREIYIYGLTNMSEVDREGVFYKKIHTRFVKSQFSNADGTFRIKLPPGKYSLFVKEYNGLYANLFDNENNISPFIVERKAYTWMTVTIDYAATY